MITWVVLMTYPSDILVPIKTYLEEKREELLARKKRLQGEDPFSDSDRLNNKAAVDADAAEQLEHETVAAMEDEIDRKLNEVLRAIARVDSGNYGNCTACGSMIDTDRLKVDPTAEYCVDCQRKKIVVE
jgi:DnaK suppressor protein